MTAPSRLLAIAFSSVLALVALGVARADGEAGLVIQYGNGSIDTYCVPFTGDSITGKDLLKRVNIPTEDYGGLVCAVGANETDGCFDANSFDSCTCKCSGSNAATCTYWAYFTASYGKPWVYSALGYSQQKSRDGDLQAWRWGRGGPNSAPAPPAISFESVCGHAPRGGAAQATAQPPTQTSQPVPTAAAGAASASPDASPALTATVSLTATAAPSTGPAATAAPSVSITITSHGTATATPPASIPASAKQDSGGAGGLILFSAVAAALVAAIGAALVWRRAHGG